MEEKTGACTEPPADFLLLDSPNSGERGTYTCPFDGCDGIVLGSPAECHTHVKEWHSAPYSCAGCSAYFAAQPALTRHVKASGHQKWICAKAGCEMKGFEFENHVEYRNHVIASASHRSLGDREADLTRAEATDPDETLSEESGEDYFMCLEPCCRRYLQQWTERMYGVHVNSHCHVAAVQEGETLRRRELSAAELEQRQGVLRMFLCDVQGCPQFGKCLASSKSYYHHLQTWNHVFPAEAASTSKDDQDGGGDDDGDGDFWLQPATRHCDVSECLQFGRRFTSETTYQRHVKSVQHLRAACRQPAPARETRRVNRRLFPAAETGEDNDEMGQRSSVSADTPVVGTPESGLSSPTPSRRRREAFLERRNRQLQDEVQRLQAQMDWLCRQN